VAILFGIKVFHIVLGVLQPNFGDNKLFPLITFVVVIVLMVALVSALGRVLKKGLDRTLLGGLDKIGGSILGALKWAFFCSAIIFLADKINVDIGALFGNVDAPMAEIVRPVAPWVIETASALIPALRDTLNAIMEMINGSTT
jgi:membrane protein required for colicin V production